MSASGRPSLSFADDQREGMRLEATRASWPTPLSNSHLGNQQSRRLRIAAPRSPEAGFITGSDLLMDGGVIAALRAGRSSLAA
jgi:hypothetical protein